MALTQTSNARLRASRLRELVVGTKEHLTSVHRRGMGLLWEVEGDTGPAEVAAELGTDAGELLALSAQMVGFIQAIDPDFEPVAPTYDFDINPDGTLTVGERLPLPDPEA